MIEEAREDEKQDVNLKIELTGNPFVDTGLGVIASLAGLDKIEDLRLSHLKKVYGNGDEITRWNSRLKAFTQIFGTNNPLYQPSYGFEKGSPSYVNKAIYKNTLKNLLDGINASKSGPRCWACGARSDFDFAKAYGKAVGDAGKKVPEEKRVGRDWFPLAGSLGSDAQALPAASQPPHICPRCLFAIHYLPMGLMLLDGKLTVFQCTSIDFWYELVGEITEENQKRVKLEKYETLGKGERGGREVIIRLCRVFENLQTKKIYGDIPEGTALYAWKFSNSGQSPECQVEEIPNHALTFLWDANQDGLRSEIESLVGTEGKNPQYSLLRCILDGRDYPNLYPSNKRTGASPKLFELYQTHVLKHSGRSLQIAYNLAKKYSVQTSEKEFARTQRSEAFREEKVRNQFRASMVQMAENGKLTLEDYLDLFPLKEGQGVVVEWSGWDLIRFYLYHTGEEDEPKDIAQLRDRPVLNSVFYYAGVIYNHYIDEKGMDRFQKEVLGQMKLGKIKDKWLRNQFAQLAESEEGFTYGHWSKLCKLGGGSVFVSELLFQMRLLWSQWIHENRKSIDLPNVPDQKLTSDGLPVRVEQIVKEMFDDYVTARGINRFHSEILLRLRRREIGLSWFKEKFTGQYPGGVQPLSEDEWEQFLVDEDGKSIKSDRLFQLHLALANLYRVKIKGGKNE